MPTSTARTYYLIFFFISELNFHNQTLIINFKKSFYITNITRTQTMQVCSHTDFTHNFPELITPPSSAVRSTQCILSSPSPAGSLFDSFISQETKHTTRPTCCEAPFVPASPAVLKPRFRRFVLNQKEGTVIKG